MKKKIETFKCLKALPPTLRLQDMREFFFFFNIKEKTNKNKKK